MPSNLLCWSGILLLHPCQAIKHNPNYLTNHSRRSFSHHCFPCPWSMLPFGQRGTLFTSILTQCALRIHNQCLKLRIEDYSFPRRSIQGTIIPLLSSSRELVQIVDNYPTWAKKYLPLALFYIQLVFPGHGSLEHLWWTWNPSLAQEGHTFKCFIYAKCMRKPNHHTYRTSSKI